MSPSQKDGDGQEKLSMWRFSPDRKQIESSWQGRWAPCSLSEVLKALKEYEYDRNKCWADHRDAQQIRERVRVLEEALREESKCRVAGCVGGKIWVSCTVHHGDWVHPEADRFGCNGGMRDCPECKGMGLGPKAVALLSPAAATEGGEGA